MLSPLHGASFPGERSNLGQVQAVKAMQAQLMGTAFARISEIQLLSYHSQLGPEYCLALPQLRYDPR